MKLQKPFTIVLLLACAVFAHAESPQGRFEIAANYKVDSHQYSPESLKLVMENGTRGCIQFSAPKDGPNRNSVYIQVEPTMTNRKLTYYLEILVGDTDEPTEILSSSAATFLGAPVKYSFTWQGKKFDVEIIFNKFEE